MKIFLVIGWSEKLLELQQTPSHLLCTWVCFSGAGNSPVERQHCWKHCQKLSEQQYYHCLSDMIFCPRRGWRTEPVNVLTMTFAALQRWLDGFSASWAWRISAALKPSLTAMVMSQGTYTFLACFAGFWLIWAVVVMLCCFCSFLQRRLKRRHEERLREQCLRTVEMEPLSCPPAPSVPPPPPPPAPPQLPRELPLFCPPPPPPPPAPRRSPPVPLPVPHPMPQATWVSLPGNVAFFSFCKYCLLFRWITLLAW